MSDTGTRRKDGRKGMIVHEHTEAQNKGYEKPYHMYLRSNCHTNRPSPTFSILKELHRGY